MAEADRPISPHLQIYKPQLTSVLSIVHRLTGVFLTLGTVMLAFWLVTAAAGPAYYAWAEWFLTSWLGYALIAAWSYALFYHLVNGIRHLFWDMGLGFDLRSTYVSGWLMLLTSLGLTGASWAIGLLFVLTRGG